MEVEVNSEKNTNGHIESHSNEVVGGQGNIIFSKKYFVSLAEKRKVPLRLFEKLSFLHIHLALNSPSHISTHRHSCPSSTSTYAGFL